MSPNEPFLIARIRINSDFITNLSWITTNKSPYQRIDPIEVDETEIDSLFKLYTQVYSKLNDKLNLKNRDALFDHRRWILVVDDSDRLVGFILFKTTNIGLKLTFAGSDGSSEGRKAIKKFLEYVFFVKGVYGEVSHAVEHIVTEKNVPKVRATVVETILFDKQLIIDKDGYHYKRLITNIGLKKKLMVGKPII